MEVSTVEFLTALESLRDALGVAVFALGVVCGLLMVYILVFAVNRK